MIYKDESTVSQEVQIEARKYNCTLMRNNSGACKDITGRLVRYGLGHISPNQKSKSSDLIGITTVIITPDMVGKKIGIFTAIEVKKEDWKIKENDERTQYQSNFLNWVIECGGIASFINSVSQVKNIFGK